MDENKETTRMRNYEILARLDESLPLATDEWLTVDMVLNRLSEFAPVDLLVELRGQIASYADDQARRAYILGQYDLLGEIVPPAELRVVA